MNPFIYPDRPAVVLAPMEGVTDAPLRSLLTKTGYYDYCVTEFLRVNDQPLQAKIFKRKVPELLQNCKTPAGVPVLIQLLGGNPEMLAESALNAAELGALGIDLNFGCPAPTVNRHDGGATLLKYPSRIEGIVRAVRDALPAHISVSAKLRLGFDDPTAIFENAKRAEQGGASFITIHGRTKTQGYTPPAYWEPMLQVRQSLSIPVIANGEIFSLNDLIRCQQQSGAIHFMLGRSALANPTLAGLIRNHLGLSPISVKNKIIIPEQMNPRLWSKTFEDYCTEVTEAGGSTDLFAKRLKQWTRYLSTKNTVEWWDAVKRESSAQNIIELLKQQ
jgi:tRNA-dihydrouridine synthase C